MKMIALSLLAAAAVSTGYVKAQPRENKTNTLIVYYSGTGNTEVIANKIQSLTGADIFRVETIKSYPADYEEMTEVAKEEKNSNARPAIKGKVENIDQYKTVFIGFPIWWGTYPMCMATFLDNYDLEGKTVIPFCTHGSGGPEQSFSTVRNASPGSTHKEGFAINGSRAVSSGSNVEKWLQGIGIID